MNLGALNAKMGKITVGDSNLNLGELNKDGKITLGDSEVNLGALNAKMEDRVGDSESGRAERKMGKITVGGSEVNLGALKDTVGEHGTTLATPDGPRNVKATTDH